MERKLNYRRIIIFLLPLCLFFSTSLAQEEETVAMDSISAQAAVPDDAIVTFNPVDRNDPVVSRQIPDSVVRKLREDDDYWYANKAPFRKKPKKEKTPEPDASQPNTWISKLLWILVAGSFVIIMVWFIASSNIQLFRKAPVATGTGEELPEEEDIFDIHYGKEIHDAVAARDFRMAVRLHYLQLLTIMAGSGLITYHPGNTNSSYIGQLSGKPQHAAFLRLTRSFEYIWYGKMELSEEKFAMIEKEFINFKQGVQR